MRSQAVGREDVVAKLDALHWPAEEGAAEGYRKLDLVTRMVQLMPPPLHDPSEEAETTIVHKLAEEQNEEPTEYAVRLPPEYHPLRSYPAIVALHGGQGPQSAIEVWAAEAARRGYIVVAPEYGLPGQPAEYRYSPSEHAAVELALRDARRRYAIDSDRVFLAGQLTGGNMAWDFALAHPDLFAGVIVSSGFPAKYVPRYLPHHERLPLYFVIGDLAPAANEIIFGSYVKPLILKAWDVTYVEYHRRGLEEFPEEIPTFFDWMDRHRRDPVPKSFDAVTARTCDNRFYGVVVHEFSPGPHHRARGRRDARPEPQPGPAEDQDQRPVQPDQPEGRRDQEPRRLGQPQDHRLQAQARGSDQRQAALQGRGQAQPSNPSSRTCEFAATASRFTG